MSVPIHSFQADSQEYTTAEMAWPLLDGLPGKSVFQDRRLPLPMFGDSGKEYAILAQEIRREHGSGSRVSNTDETEFDVSVRSAREEL